MNEKDYEYRLSRIIYYICLLVCFILFVCYLALSYFDIAITEIYPETCMLYRVMGLYCPGCGGTRAVHFLLTGKLIKSFIYHPAVLYAAVLVGAYLILHTIHTFSKGRCKAPQFKPIYFYVMIVIIILQCIIKNVLLVGYNINYLG